MNKCLKIQEMLADYRTGILSAGKSREIEAHLLECEECAAELKALDDVLELMESNSPQCEPPAGLWNGVYNRITSPEPRRSSFGDKLRGFIAMPARAAGVGVAALALAVGLMLSGGHDNQPGQMTVASNNAYIQGHALYASQAPLADSVSYVSLADLSDAHQGEVK